MQNLTVRKAVARDLERIMEIFDAAKAYMHSHGNINQWNSAYPQRELMRSEIACGHCYVVCNDGAVVGTFCLIFGEDPTYAVIEDGQWKNEAPYATIHRLASDGSVKGIGHACAESSISRTVRPASLARSHSQSAHPSFFAAQAAGLSAASHNMSRVPGRKDVIV
jgi:hypothetical protein